MPQLRTTWRGSLRFLRSPRPATRRRSQAALLAVDEEVVELLREAGVGTSLARASGYRSASGEIRRRRARRPCCSTATTTWCRSATSPSGSRHRSRRRARRRDYGRGSADTKSNISCTSVRSALGGRPPVGIKVVIEGHGRGRRACSTHIPAFTAGSFAADAMVIATWQRSAGRPDAHDRLARHRDGDVEVRRSGSRSTAASSGRGPDALIVLLHALRLHCTTSTAMSPSRVFVVRSGQAPRTPTTSSASSRRSRPACRSSAPVGSGRASGPYRRSRSTGIDVPSGDNALNAVVAALAAKPQPACPP